MGTNELIITAASREQEVEVIMIMDVVTSHDEKFRSNRGSHRQLIAYCSKRSSNLVMHASFVISSCVRPIIFDLLPSSCARKEGFTVCKQKRSSA